MDQKSKLLTIGQFAALHGINKKTLMWYDEMRVTGQTPEKINLDYNYQC